MNSTNYIHDQISKDVIIQFLRDHKDFLRNKFGVTKIALFGSYARNEATQSSDIDILIEVLEKDFKKRFYLQEFLEKTFNKKVDIGYFDNLRPFIKRYVEKDLVYA